MKFTEKIGISNKHLQISKANSTALIAAAATTAIVIFCLVASMALVKQLKYQNKVISLRSKAASQLSKNVKAAETLEVAYKTFDGTPESVIGTAEKNSKIILDALPSKYDFPALATSLQGIITGSGSKVNSISGTDNEAQAEQNSADPKTVDIAFQLSSSGNFAAAQKLILDLERSIRPIMINTINLSGNDSSLQVLVDGVTYYQPEKKLEVKSVTISESGKASTTTAAGVKK